MIPQGHILGEDPEVDSIICHPEEEETMLTTQQCCAEVAAQPIPEVCGRYLQYLW